MLALQQPMREKFMKKINPELDELRKEYKRSDFGIMQRGKYAVQATEESNIIVLEPDVAKVFNNDKMVNEALREYITTH